MGGDHAMAGIVEQKVPQEVICLLPGQGSMGLVSRKLLLNRPEQGSVEDRRLLLGQDLTPVFDFADEKPVPEEVGEGSSSERDASGSRSPVQHRRAAHARFLETKRPTQIVNRVVPSIYSVRSIIVGGWWPSGRVRHRILSYA